jgi:S-layer homology domain
MKKWLPILLIIVMVIGSIPSWAASDFSNILAVYDHTEHRLTVTGETTNTAIAVFIYHPDGSLINFKSLTLESNNFSVIFNSVNAAVNGIYTVKLANYNGGAYTNHYIIIVNGAISEDTMTGATEWVGNTPSTPAPVTPQTEKPTPPTRVIEGDAVILKASFEKAGTYQTPLETLKEADKLEIKGDVSMVFDSKALEKIGITGALEVTAKPVAIETIDETVRKQIGDRPVFEFNVKVDGKPISQFGSGSITLSIPYTLRAGENPEAILVYYVDAEGKIKTMKSKYENGQVTFTTNHFSKYVVGYNEVKFSDVSKTDWYAEFITYLSSRNLINGKSTNTFSPNDLVSRAEVVNILAKMSGETLTVPQANIFRDVKATDWYAAPVYWAVKKGIVSGMNDQTFAPNQPISRQDLAVLLTNFLQKVEGKSLAEVTTQKAFMDAAKISPYAKDAVSMMQKAGIISGKSNNTFDPAGKATRAEVAKVLSLLLKGMIQ